MSDSLTTYIHDHLAGSKFAIDLLEFLRDQHKGEPLGGLAAGLLAEVEEDREVLQALIQRLGGGFPVLKEAAAWIGEKLSRLKLAQGAFGTFEALEALALGIAGKLGLWRALQTIADTDTRVRGLDFDRLIARAVAQHDQVETLRLRAARAALPAPSDR